MHAQVPCCDSILYKSRDRNRHYENARDLIGTKLKAWGISPTSVLSYILVGGSHDESS